MSRFEVVVDRDGSLAAVYADGSPLAAVAENHGGERRITRASHVEPTTDGRWSADLSPVGGPVLGPFGLRSEALAAEVAWLRELLMGTGPTPRRRDCTCGYAGHGDRADVGRCRGAEELGAGWRCVQAGVVA